MIGLFNKKANVIIDVLVLFVVLFIVSVSWIIAGNIQRDLNDDIQASELPSESKSIHQTFTDKYNKIFDGAIMFFLILFWALTIVSSFLIDTHPVFFVFNLVILLLIFGVIIALANIFSDIMAESDLTGESSYFPLTFWIMDNLLVISIVIGFTVLLSLFARPQT